MLRYLLWDADNHGLMEIVMELRETSYITYFIRIYL